MGTFGSELRRLRMAEGLRQVDLVRVLDTAVARSTLANVEVGREPPTARLWEAIQSHFPDWTPQLAHQYDVARRNARRGRKTSEMFREMATRPQDGLGGPFVLESIAYTYVFRHSRSPEEIIEVRRVRALAAGADGFGLKFTHTGSQGFDMTQEGLWGGHLEEHCVERSDGSTVWLSRFVFDRRMQKGQIHEFAVRSWVEADPEPQRAVSFELTAPAREVTLNLLFNGPQAPQDAWAYEVRDDVHGPTEYEPPGDPDDPAWLYPIGSNLLCRWREPDLHVVYGVSWIW